MRWGTIVGVVLLTMAAGAGAAMGLASFLIAWLQISDREGASGYFAVYVTGMGLIGGFIVGLVTALVMQSGFWKVQAVALAIVLALTVAAGTLSVALDDKGPRIDGDKLILEVELKFPAGWKPDNKAKSERGSFCWLQEKAADGATEVNPIVLGGLTLRAAPEMDGRWAVSCAVTLNKSSKHRFLRVFVGRKTDLTIQVPLPGKPGRADEQWSPWTTQGFLPQEGKPAATDHAFRYRVQRQAEYDKQHPDQSAAFQEAQQAALAAVPADAPLVQWLPFFENERGQALPFSSGVYPQLEAVKARPAELAPLLRSRDRDVARRAIFATGALYQTPASLIEPLAVAGRLTIQLMQAARAGALPDDPDLRAADIAHTYFFYWDMAMAQAGAAGTQSRRMVLEEIERAARTNATEGGIYQIGKDARKALEQLGAAGAVN